MPRPLSKDELLDLSELNLKKLLSFIEELPKEWKIKEYKNDEVNNHLQSRWLESAPKGGFKTSFYRAIY